jgi:hypothetical protein
MPNASLTIDGTEVIKKENGVVSLKNTNADTSLSFPANHAGIKTALNASGDAPIYACRAWVNFNGSQITNPASTTGIRESENVSSVMDIGGGTQGLYRVYFTTNMPDVNYSCVATGGSSSVRGNSINILNMDTDLVEFSDGIDSVYYDSTYVCIACFR